MFLMQYKYELRWNFSFIFFNMTPIPEVIMEKTDYIKNKSFLVKKITRKKVKNLMTH